MHSCNSHRNFIVRDEHLTRLLAIQGAAGRRPCSDEPAHGWRQVHAAIPATPGPPRDSPDILLVVTDDDSDTDDSVASYYSDDDRPIGLRRVQPAPVSYPPPVHHLVSEDNSDKLWFQVREERSCSIM